MRRPNAAARRTLLSVGLKDKGYPVVRVALGVPAVSRSPEADVRRGRTSVTRPECATARRFEGLRHWSRLTTCEPEVVRVRAYNVRLKE